MEQEKLKDEKALENKCPKCNSSIAFNPTLGKWKCSYCTSEFTLEEMQQYSNNASTEEKNRKENNNIDENFEYISYKCDSCGAEIIADSQTSATFCVYCGNTAILKSKLSGKFSPDLIIPFKKEKEEAITAFKNLSKGRPLMPRDFNKESNIEKIRGIYIPFWLYDINVSGDLVMSATTSESWSVGDTHYTKTNYFTVTRGGTMDFDSIPVDGSTRFDNDIMNTLEPFEYKDLIKYNHAYLSGFYAEKYDQESDQVYSEAANRALASAKDKLLAEASRYSSKTITSNTLQATQLRKQYALLPVWMVNVKYKEKTYIFAMNGQTGEFIGNIPVDGKRALKYFFIIFISIFIFVIIASYIAYLGGA